MNVSKHKNMSGRLSLWEITCFFEFSDGYCLKITPETDNTEQFKEKCKDLKGCYDHIGWIHGTDEWKHDIAFFSSEQQGPLCYHAGVLTLIIDIILEVTNSKNVKGEYIYDYKDLTGFNAIDFVGTPVDSVFSPKQAIKRSEQDKNCIEWLDFADFAKEYPVCLNGIECKLIFTVCVDRHDYDLNNNDLGRAFSILRLEFNERQPVDMLETCWQSACTFLTFCVGSYNVTNLEIKLWDEKHSVGSFGYQGLIDCFVNNDTVEDIQLPFSSYYRFPVCSLGEKTGDVFSLLNNEKTHPVLGFLPRHNSDIQIDRNKLRELCTAFEVEYELRGDELPNDNVKALVNRLKDEVKAYKKENPDAIAENTYSYIFSSLSFISLPARDKVMSIYKKYAEIIDEHIKHSTLLSGITINVEEEQTYQDIAWVVKTRNSITHAMGITDTEIPNAIFARLKTAIFCSVLERAGYTHEDIQQIMQAYFNGVVMD